MKIYQMSMIKQFNFADANIQNVHDEPMQFFCWQYTKCSWVNNAILLLKIYNTSMTKQCNFSVENIQTSFWECLCHQTRLFWCIEFGGQLSSLTKTPSIPHFECFDKVKWMVLYGFSSSTKSKMAVCQNQPFVYLGKSIIRHSCQKIILDLHSCNGLGR